MYQKSQYIQVQKLYKAREENYVFKGGNYSSVEIIHGSTISKLKFEISQIFSLLKINSIFLKKIIRLEEHLLI